MIKQRSIDPPRHLFRMPRKRRSSLSKKIIMNLDEDEDCRLNLQLLNL